MVVPPVVTPVFGFGTYSGDIRFIAVLHFVALEIVYRCKRCRNSRVVHTAYFKR